MSIKQARERLHTDIVETSELIHERDFILYLPDEAKDMTHSHKGKRKQVHTLSSGQTLEVPETEGSDEPDVDEGKEEDDILNEGEGEEDDDDPIPVVTEKEFLESFHGINSVDTSFGVGIRTVNFSIPNLTQEQNYTAQQLLHELFRDELVLYARTPEFGREVTRKLHAWFKLSQKNTPLISEYTDMAVSMGKSLISYNKGKK